MLGGASRGAGSFFGEKGWSGAFAEKLAQVIRQKISIFIGLPRRHPKKRVGVAVLPIIETFIQWIGKELRRGHFRFHAGGAHHQVAGAGIVAIGSVVRAGIRWQGIAMSVRRRPAPERRRQDVNRE